jgi:hypothetical protein
MIERIGGQMKTSIKLMFIVMITAGFVGVVHSNGYFGDPDALRVAETRCGWFVNPTPANAWLVDADREWIIGTQGGEQAEGDWPNFKPSQWVETNVHYGYGCACMKVETNKADDRITRIFSATAKPLSACRKDKALKGKEPGR